MLSATEREVRPRSAQPSPRGRSNDERLYGSPHAQRAGEPECDRDNPEPGVIVERDHTPAGSNASGRTS